MAPESSSCSDGPDKPWIFKMKRTIGGAKEPQDLILDLNSIIGNKEGHFHQPGKNFAAEATNIHRKGWVIYADLKKGENYYQDAINLEQCLFLDKNSKLDCRLELPPDAVPVGLCDVCKEWPAGRAVGKWTTRKLGMHVEHAEFLYEFRALLKDVTESKDNNKCPVCDLIFRVTEHLAKEDQRYANPNLLCEFGQHREGSTYIRFMFEEDKETGRMQQFELIRADNAPSESSTFAQVYSGGDIIPHPMSDQAIAKVNHWVDACVRTHSKCVPRKGPLPTRILDVGDEGSDTVKLVISNGREGQYIALSYCWGDVTGANLLESNINKYLEGFPIKELPRTYQDAIDFCRGLSIKYLWIDALCILQKHEEDWRIESAKMAEYYGGSHLCISATSSKNLEAGCIAQRSPVEFSGIGRDNKPYTVFLQPQIRHIYDSLPDESPDERASNFPVLDRAWCYQERRLAPRVLHFAGGELFFECSEMSACECGKNLETSRGAWTKDREAFYVGHADMSLQKDESKKVPHEWFAHVHDFSGLNITYADNRLPAISGLAKQYQEKAVSLGIDLGRYLAGIWETQLIDGLSWCVGKDLSNFRRNGDDLVFQTNGLPLAGSISVDLAKSWSRYWKEGIHVRLNPRQGVMRPHKEKVNEYVAPSWSWVSVRDTVFYNTPWPQPLVSVVNIDIKLKDEGIPLAEVQPGSSITLHGKLRPSHWKLVQSEGQTFWCLTDFPGEVEHKYKRWYPDSQSTDLPNELYLMPLALREGSEIAKKFLPWKSHTVYLVLKTVGEGAYERVGWVHERTQPLDMKGAEDVNIKIF